jgi:hypothetical protein
MRAKMKLQRRFYSQSGHKPVACNQAVSVAVYIVNETEDVAATGV